MLTEEQIEYIKTHYADMTNNEIGEVLGLNPRTVLYWGFYKWGMHKSDALRKEVQRRCTAAAAEYWHTHERSEEFIANFVERAKKTRFKKGHNLREKIGAERDDERRRKSAESRKKTVRAERRRVMFGLPQKTKLNVVQQPRSKMSLRYVMRRHGYIEDKVNHIFYRPKDVPPRTRAEKVMINKYKYQIREL